MRWRLAPTGPRMPIPIYMGKPSGPYHSRFGGVCNTPLPCRSIVFIRMGRAQQHTPHQTSPERGQMWFLGYVDGRFMGDRLGPTLRLPWGGAPPPPPPTSFSCLDTRKGGKRRSRLRSPKLKDELRTLKSEKLASLRSASDTRISGRVLATRLSGRLGTDAVPPDAQWATDGLTDKKWILPYVSGSYFSTVRVGAYCIRPIRRPRQGDECGCPVISQGNLLGAIGPCRA